MSALYSSAEVGFAFFFFLIITALSSECSNTPHLLMTRFALNCWSLLSLQLSSKKGEGKISLQPPGGPDWWYLQMSEALPVRGREGGTNFYEV